MELSFKLTLHVLWYPILLMMMEMECKINARYFILRDETDNYESKTSACMRDANQETYEPRPKHGQSGENSKNRLKCSCPRGGTYFRKRNGFAPCIYATDIEGKLSKSHFSFLRV